MKLQENLTPTNREIYKKLNDMVNFTYLLVKHNEATPQDIINFSKYIGVDRHYLEGNKIENILSKQISDLNEQEIKTYFTFILRRDHFDGHSIEGSLEDGTIRKLIERYMKIC